MLIRTVETVVATNSAGQIVESLPVREVVDGETDIVGRPVDVIPVSEDPSGVPVRFVTTKSVQSSAGQLVDTIPVKGGAPVDPLDITRDKFLRTSGPLNGSKEQKGATWQATGASANPLTDMIAGGGQMYSTNGSDAANYGRLPQTKVPFEIGCRFKFAGSVDSHLPTLACFVQQDFIPDGRILHLFAGDAGGGQVNLGPNFFHPAVSATVNQMAWTARRADFVPTAEEEYTLIWRFKPPYVRGWLRNKAGTLIAEVAGYEPRMSEIVGQWAFWETFNSKLRYLETWTRDDDGSFVNPSLSPTLYDFVSGVQGWEASPLGGAAAPTFNATGQKLNVTMGAQYQGVRRSLGVLQAGWVPSFSVEVTGKTGNNIWGGITNASFWESGNSEFDITGNGKIVRTLAPIQTTGEKWLTLISAVSTAAASYKNVVTAMNAPATP